MNTRNHTTLATLCVALSFSAIASAQDPDVFRYGIADFDHDTPSEEWSLPASAGADAVFFFKNNEYFAPSAEGYTLVGYTFRPTVDWNLGESVTIISGLHALRYGGEDRFHNVWPFFAGIWRMGEKAQIRLGNLIGSASHGLPEAILDPEDQLVGTPELGAQFDVRGEKAHAQWWLNWRQFIFMGDTIPEKFTAGISAEFFTHSRLFRLPVCAVFNHIGGQISNFSEPMQSLVNVSVEPSLRTGYVHATLRLLGFHTMAGSSVRPFADGWALQPEIKVFKGIFRASASWFRSHNYYSLHGNPLLMSLSNYNATVYEPNRSLLILHADLIKSIAPCANFNVNLGGYYDTFAHRFDYSYGLTMTVWPAWNRGRFGDD